MTWLTIAGLALKLLGLTAWAEQLEARWAGKRAGRREQAATDTTETLKIVTAQRDAADRAGSAENAAERGEF